MARYTRVTIDGEEGRKEREEREREGNFERVKDRRNGDIDERDQIQIERKQIDR